MLIGTDTLGMAFVMCLRVGDDNRIWEGRAHMLSEIVNDPESYMGLPSSMYR